MEAFSIRPFEEKDKEWIREATIRHWGTPSVVSHGIDYYPDSLRGFVAEQADRLIGFIAYEVRSEACEVIALVSEVPGQGVGTDLLQTMKGAAKDMGCYWVWLIVTNDNIDALRFFQRRDLVLSTINKKAMDIARKTRPAIPLLGHYGIPLRDEIELEIPLD